MSDWEPWPENDDPYATLTVDSRWSTGATVVVANSAEEFRCEIIRIAPTLLCLRVIESRDAPASAQPSKDGTP